MKKSFIIIAGILVIVLLLAVWAYLFFFGTPETADDIFADLGLSGEVDTNYVPPPVVEPEEPVVNMERPKLRQLTTKPVAGFREVSVSTTTPPRVYYVEQGTGHVYTIDTVTGEEVRISGTTVAQAEQAVIAPDGRYVAISSFSNTKNKPLYVGTFGTSSADLREVTKKTVRDFTLVDNALLYTSASPGALQARALSLPSQTETTLFTVPFSEARVVWGEGAGGNHYVYPKASYALEGFLYRASTAGLVRLPVSGFGLTANASGELVVFSRVEGQTTKSYIHNLTTDNTQPLTAAVVPEKCIIAPVGLEFICPFEAVAFPYQFPDEWYKGNLNFKDSLWLLNAETMSGEMLVDTFASSAREIDIINLQVSDTGGVLYFTNKNDNTLWMYEI